MLKNDYSTVAPEILEALSVTASVPSVGYGEDEFCQIAEKKILGKFGLTDGAVVFLSGGTQANMTVISYLLRPWESAVAVQSAHINGHESAAVEGTGHKIVTFPGKDGKLRPKEIEAAVLENAGVHTARPKLVYLSQATESGTVYTKAELAKIRKICDENGLYLFIDGARLGSALACDECDMTPAEFAKFPDVFYVGGTKNGLLFGEAVVFRDKKCAEDFRRFSKNRGAMSAKGFVLGVQFSRLFDLDNLYFEFAKRANRTAKIIRDGLKDAKIPVSDAPTNQVFTVFPKEKAKVLMNDFGCQIWREIDGDTVEIRAVTAFDTTDSEAKLFVKRAREVYFD